MREPIINIAIDAARTSGNIIIRALHRLDKVRVSEKKPNDYVTDIDQKVEETIISIIKKSYPSHGIIGEESGIQDGDEYQWIIDPIDGTRNFIHGYPHFAVSIAISCKNKIEHGVIYDPVRQELFTASRGKGAQLNERRIRVGQQKHLQGCLLGSGFSCRHLQDAERLSTQVLHTLLPVCGDIRNAGAATLDLAYVACGRLDGFWEFGLHLWDIAAGVLLVKEAGGFVCDPTGGENHLKTGDLIAANPSIVKKFLKTIQPAFQSVSKPE